MKIDLASLSLLPMQPADVDEVVAIEQAVYSHPWSRGNFVDSLKLGYDAWQVRNPEGVLLGYFVQMPVVDETHLLTIAVLAQAQKQGIARLLLNHLLERARAMGMDSILLEVRVSNQSAISVYEAFGFALVGRRKAYYQVSPTEREDALMLRYILDRSAA